MTLALFLQWIQKNQLSEPEIPTEISICIRYKHSTQKVHRNNQWICLIATIPWDIVYFWMYYSTILPGSAHLLPWHHKGWLPRRRRVHASFMWPPYCDLDYDIYLFRHLQVTGGTSAAGNAHQIRSTWFHLPFFLVGGFTSQCLFGPFWHFSPYWLSMKVLC